MAFTSLAARLRQRPAALAVWTVLIRLLVLLAAALVAWGAWQQVLVGLGSRSVVLGYPTALLPLPALLCSASIAAFALFELVARKPLAQGPAPDAE
jgi:gluconokinase